MTLFKPCIDIHQGQVKQIIGSSLCSTNEASLITNHVSEHSAKYFAQLYQHHNLSGGHIILLDDSELSVKACREACETWPGAFSVGGGITPVSAQQWLQWGAGSVIVTSYLFTGSKFAQDKLDQMLRAVKGNPQQLVVDLSCRKLSNTNKSPSWFVAKDKWQTITNLQITCETIRMLQQSCGEFLVHAADHEGKLAGMDHDLIAHLAQWCNIPVTYAGGANSFADLQLVHDLSHGKVDLTIGSALDIFGGKSVKLDDCIKWNSMQIVKHQGLVDRENKNPAT